MNEQNTKQLLISQIQQEIEKLLLSDSASEEEKLKVLKQAQSIIKNLPSHKE